ncbi:hypothetical protein B0H13DRAFT_2654939 [Mycena leptocephala]|nr:hypothetical protein B0H13DRAFT_2654939 [Mycena leptocephala]
MASNSTYEPQADAICRVIRELQSEKTLWLNALIRIREVKMKPLPLSTGDALDALSLPGLQNVSAGLGSSAFQEPTSRWPIQTMGIDSEWFYLQPQAVCTEIKGKALIGAWIQGYDIGNLMRLAVICIDFRDRAHVAISEPRYKHATVQNFPFPPLSASGIHRITSDVPPGPSTISLGQSNAPEIHGPEYTFVGRVDGPRVFAPQYGIFAVTSFAGTLGGTELVNLVHFWPGHADCDSETIEFGPHCVYQHPDRISNTAVGASGAYVLILVRQEEPYLEPYLGLVHFSPAPVPHTIFRKLDVGDVTISSCQEMALDESLGLVIVVDGDGRVTTISYA